MQIHSDNQPVGDLQTDLLVVGLFQDDLLTGPLQELDARLKGALKEAVEAGEIDGQWLNVWATATLGGLAARRLAVLGLGSRSDFDVRRLRLAAGRAAQEARRFNSSHLAFLLPSLDWSADQTAELVTDGILVGYWRFERYGHAASPDRLEQISLLGLHGQGEAGIERGQILAAAQNWVRELGMRPANKLYPEKLAEEAVQAGQRHGFAVEVFDQHRLAELGMEAILGIGQGSAHPPRLVVMRYHGGGHRCLALVGKGITFDSGGISLKPGAGMEEMKFDMLGAGAVLGAMIAVADLKLPIDVVGVMAVAQNVPSGTAILPGDVVKAFNGKTIEVTNTDAEGRVVLADAVSYVASLQVDGIVEASTLTGAAITVLGHEASALVSTNDALASLVLEASQRAAERVWRLPVYPEYQRLYRSSTADIKNSPGREAGTITAGMIIAEFAGDVPFAHLDIAGSAWTPRSPLNGIKNGPTGVMVRTFVQVAELMSH